MYAVFEMTECLNSPADLVTTFNKEPVLSCANNVYCCAISFLTICCVVFSFSCCVVFSFSCCVVFSFSCIIIVLTILTGKSSTEQNNDVAGCTHIYVFTYQGISFEKNDCQLRKGEDAYMFWHIFSSFVFKHAFAAQANTHVHCRMSISFIEEV